MSLREATALRPGDEVYWKDPDPDSDCSRHYTISEIEIKGDIVSIVDKDGDCLECFARELK